MLNITLGDCTCAAFYHAIRSGRSKPRKSKIQSRIRMLSSSALQACGYNPKKGGEGPGGNEQKVLEYILTKGKRPARPSSGNRHKNPRLC